MTFVISILETITLLNVVGFKTIWAKHVHNLLFRGIRDFSFKNNVKRDLRKVWLGAILYSVIVSMIMRDQLSAAKGRPSRCSSSQLSLRTRHDTILHESRF